MQQFKLAAAHLNPGAVSKTVDVGLELLMNPRNSGGRIGTVVRQLKLLTRFLNGCAAILTAAEAFKFSRGNRNSEGAV